MTPEIATCGPEASWESKAELATVVIVLLLGGGVGKRKKKKKYSLMVAIQKIKNRITI